MKDRSEQIPRNCFQSNRGVARSRGDRRLSASILLLAFSVTLAPAQVITNGDFETGDLSDWTMYGTATVTDSAYRGFPFEDSQQAFISNASGSISPGTLESNLGLVTGSFDSMGNGTTSEGSAMVQNFNVLEGSTLTFRWNFATEETEAFFLANDFAFVHIQRIGASSQPPETLSSQLSMGNTATQTGSPLRTDGYTRETGYQTFTYLIPASGNYQLAFGVLDVRDGDVAFDSALFVDDVQMLAPVPEPWACSLAAGIGLGLFAVARRLTVRSRTAHVA